MTRLRLLALAAVSMELGQREVGNTNWGPRVKEYLASADIFDPAPWCAALQFFAITNAAKDHGLRNPLGLITHRGLVADYPAFAKDHGMLVPQPHAGDLVCFQFGNHWDHIGIARADGAVRMINTIEGNTNDNGSRDGYGVFKKDRPVPTTRACFIEWDRGLTAEPLPKYAQALAALGIKVA